MHSPNNHHASMRGKIVAYVSSFTNTGTFYCLFPVYLFCGLALQFIDLGAADNSKRLLGVKKCPQRILSFDFYNSKDAKLARVYQKLNDYYDYYFSNCELWYYDAGLLNLSSILNILWAVIGIFYVIKIVKLLKYHQ